MNDQPSVVLERELDAPIDAVYRAWTDPAKLRHWFHASADTVVEEAEVDLTIGGRYRIVIKGGADVFVVFGAYSRIEPPHVLEFTWQWEVSSIEPGETQVLLELTPIGERTHLRLTHTKFTTPRSIEAHDKGWTGVLNTLALYVASEKTS